MVVASESDANSLVLHGSKGSILNQRGLFNTRLHIAQ